MAIWSGLVDRLLSRRNDGVKEVPLIWSKYFKQEEFVCRCGCGVATVHPLLVAVLDNLRLRCGIPLVVNSGYRCPKHNAAVGGEPASQHMLGTAADLSCSNLDLLLSHANGLGLSVGDGRSQGFIHVDVRNLLVGHPAKWSY